MVKKIKSDKNPLWDGQTVFKILDKDTGNLSFGCYTNYEIAKTVCTGKNFKNDPESI